MNNCVIICLGHHCYKYNPTLVFALISLTQRKQENASESTTINSSLLNHDYIAFNLLV